MVTNCGAEDNFFFLFWNSMESFRQQSIWESWDMIIEVMDNFCANVFITYNAFNIR